MMRLSFRALLLAAAVFPGTAMAQDAPVSDPKQAAEVPREATPEEGTQTIVSGQPEQIAEQRREARDAAGSDAQADIEVTGSRLSDGDVTSQKIIITREQIKARGVTSVEDLVRTLPQSVNTIGAITNERGRGPLAQRARGSSVSRIGSLGVSAANLGGTGASNTLVLVNGRRLAGAAGIEDGFVNLNGIPLSAIERVEIIPSGSAAVYGADALSGVINFILRKEGKGLTLGSQALVSSTDADSARFNAFGAFSWGSGRISGTADYQKRKPVNNRKTGYVTDDYSSYFNGDPQFDYRRFSSGLQPGVIDQSGPRFDPVTGTFPYVFEGLTVRPGLDRPPTVADFIPVGREALRDFIPEFAGPQSETISFTANIDQKITDRLSFFAQGMYSRAKNQEQASLEQGLMLTLAPGQAYNPFPAFGSNDFPALQEAYYGVKGAPTRYKHVLVISDGDVSNGAFEQLIRHMSADGVNVSTVVPVAGERGIDNMAQWARWGLGRFYYVPDDASLVQLDLSVPGATALPNYRPAAAPPRTTVGQDWWRDIGSPVPPPVAGLVRVDVRPEADTIVGAGTPLLASWLYGRGRVTAMMTEPLGQGTRGWAGWPRYGEWLARVVARTAAPDVPLTVALDRDGGDVTLTIQRTDGAGGGMPEARLEQGPRIALTQRAPGLFVGTVAVLADRAALVSVRDGDLLVRAADRAFSDSAGGRPFSMLRALPLAGLSRVTGGTASDADADPVLPPSDGGAGDRIAVALWGWAALVALLCYIMEIAWRRWPSRHDASAREMRI